MKKTDTLYTVRGEVNAGFGWLFRMKQFYASSEDEARLKATIQWTKAKTLKLASIRILWVRMGSSEKYMRAIEEERR